MGREIQQPTHVGLQKAVEQSLEELVGYIRSSVSSTPPPLDVEKHLLPLRLAC